MTGLSPSDRRWLREVFRHLSSRVDGTLSAPLGRSTPLPQRFGPICEPCWLRAGRVLPVTGCACADDGADAAAPGGPR